MRMWIVVGVLVGVASLVAGCGDTGGSGGTQPSTTADAQVVEPTHDFHISPIPALSHMDEVKLLFTTDRNSLFYLTNPPQAPRLDIYTEDNDPDKLMGRPNSYVARCAFADPHVGPVPPSTERIRTVDGGSVEIYPTEADAKSKYLFNQEVGKANPRYVEYLYLHGKILIRLSNGYTPTQAEERHQALVKALGV